MFVAGIAERPNSLVVALCDHNTVRSEYYNQVLEKQGRPRAPIFQPAQFKEMLASENVDTVVVTTVDATHHLYIIPALEAGGDCLLFLFLIARLRPHPPVRVITEKPMTTEVEKCRAVNRACKSIGKHITVRADSS
jgi:predicted dehydrogenase